MPKCTVCNHPQSREITEAFMRRVPYRAIGAQYSVSRCAIERHFSAHVPPALQMLQAAEMSLPEAAAIAEPVLGEMRKLNARALRILEEAETAKDRGTALIAIRECRRNLELIARLTGELDPRSAGETSGPLTVTIEYVQRPIPSAARQLGGGSEEGQIVDLESSE